MSKSKIIGLLTAGVMTFSLSTTLNAKGFTTNLLPGNSQPIFQTESNCDLAIANDEKLQEMLKKNGTIPKDASEDEADRILGEYLNSKKGINNTDPSVMDTKSLQGLKKYGKEATKKGFLKESGTKEKKKKNDPQTSWDGSVTKDKALVLLIEFPDLPHNTLTASDTDMYYKDYTKSHYNDMIFGENGYTGPNNENLVSLKQYYDQESGKSYDIEGNVLGWYKASKPAAYYGSNSGSNNNVNIRDLVKEALINASKEVNLKDYDLKDPYDIDGDGDLNEPDGIIDHLMLIHSGMGEEAGGGSLGTDAIWSHSSKIFDVVNGASQPWKIPGTDMSAYPYTTMPEDGAAGVFCHEFGHDLGLPDEYDTQYTGKGEPISYWSIMSSGSWAGTIPGTEPTGFSPYAKEFFQKKYGGNWSHGNTVDLSELTTKGKKYTLDASSIKDSNNDVVKVTLPKKATTITTPVSGQNLYFSGKGNSLNNSMTTTIDLTNATSANFNFKAWYDIEKDWDYGSVAVQIDGSNTWTSIPGNITTTTNPNNQNPGNGITGKSNGWVDASFDLKDYIGKKINLKINYWTDVAAEMSGLYVDDIALNIDGKASFLDDAEGTSKFTMNGFSKNDGKKLTDQYYLLQFRNHSGVDKGLDHIKRRASFMSYKPGLLIWYADELYSDNWTGIHPGHGYLGIVDGDQKLLKWSDGSIAETKFQMHDATFSTNKDKDMFIDYSTKTKTLTLSDTANSKNPTFEDDRTYINNQIPDAGMYLPRFGLKVNVIDQTDDSSQGNIVIKLK
ncbi:MULTISPECIES: immune inhibitor A domain-containing protein [Clostridium]|uniref:Immune inhibitor A n=1 Tax=Clostridium cibarium TaxID=2762247 RepID=A0ABR8PSJ3_9CLOT|nr:MULTISPECIES: immune inhibitor A domain-containing protein [Clostridium]MBD7911151.1 immune inhibitor A [Clostridium cibarium]